MFRIPFKWIVPTLLLCSMAGDAMSAGRSEAVLKSKGFRRSTFLDLAESMVDEGLAFSAIPLVKEFLVENPVGTYNPRLDKLLDAVILQAGVRQFEVLPIDVLNKSNSPSIYYIKAKKLFRLGDYTGAMQNLTGKVPGNHPIKPFSLMLEGSIFSIKGQFSYALEAFRECVKASNSRMSDTSDKTLLRQLEINRDTCVIGTPRTEFAAKQYANTIKGYSELPKSSYVWPQILFEEAWTNFYDKTYNRTLGKLVTYKAPVLSHTFNPEIDILRAMTYFKMCLWDDAKKEVDEFYARYSEDAKQLKQFIQSQGNDYNSYYNIAITRVNDTIRNNKLLENIFADVVRETAYIELMDSYRRGKGEIARIKEVSDARLRNILLYNLKRTLILQRDLIGSYVRRSVMLKYVQLYNAFEDMSYIKLEVLSFKKTDLYIGSTEGGSRQRGDIKNLSRQDNQYFWTFNGEFWADELGDYVFSLKSECKE